MVPVGQQLLNLNPLGGCSHGSLPTSALWRLAVGCSNIELPVPILRNKVARPRRTRQGKTKGLRAECSTAPYRRQAGARVRETPYNMTFLFLGVMTC